LHASRRSRPPAHRTDLPAAAAGASAAADAGDGAAAAKPVPLGTGRRLVRAAFGAVDAGAAQGHGGAGAAHDPVTLAGGPATGLPRGRAAAQTGGVARRLRPAGPEAGDQ